MFSFLIWASCSHYRGTPSVISVLVSHEFKLILLHLVFVTSCVFFSNSWPWFPQPCFIYLLASSLSSDPSLKFTLYHVPLFSRLMRTDMSLFTTLASPRTLTMFPEKASIKLGSLIQTSLCFPKKLWRNMSDRSLWACEENIIHTSDMLLEKETFFTGRRSKRNPDSSNIMLKSQNTR